MTYADIARRLRALGCVEDADRRRGSHRRWVNPATGHGATVPDWGRSDLQLGTLRSALKQLGIDWDDFNAAR
jgi:predicted RNA binding protein YcfA (HicA-like mRNA interferase family)